MKRFKIALASLLVVAALGASFAFTTANKAHKVITTWYTLAVGANPHDPSQYTLFGTSDPGFSTGTNVAAIKIDIGTEKYTSGVNNGKPIVDVSTTTLFAAIDQALDVAHGGANPQPIANRVELR